MIAALPINKLIERPDVKRFMVAMTKGSNPDGIVSEAMKVPEIQKIVLAT